MGVAGYFRVSVARDDMKAPEIYRTEIERYCAYKNLKLVEIYSDIDRSGYKGSRNRPGLQALLDDRDNYTAVIVPKLSRFGRSMAHLTELFETFDRDRIDLVFLDIGIDTSTSQGRLLRNIMAAFAEFESDVKGDYARANYRHSLERGIAWGSAPVGYVRDSDGIFTVVEAIAPSIREIYQRWLQGETQVAIVRDLHARNAPGGPWGSRKLGRILDNPTYGGYLVLDGELKQGRWEAIVEPETWMAARRKRERHLDHFRDKRRLGRKRYLLTGLLMCGLCGSKMHHQNRPAGRSDYRCDRTKDGLCRGGSVGDRRAERIVADAFFERCRFVTDSGVIGTRELWEVTPLEHRRRVLATVIDKVMVHPRPAGEPPYVPRRLEIVWRDGDSGALLAAAGEAHLTEPKRSSDRVARSRELVRNRRAERVRAYHREWREHLERMREGR